MGRQPGGFFSPGLAGSDAWVSHGPDGGYVTALAIDPLIPTTLYAGMHDGGVFKSTDCGLHWNAARSGLTSLKINALVVTYGRSVDPTAPASLYAMTQDSGVFKSTDSGSNWSAANNGLDNSTVFVLAIDPQQAGSLIAGTALGGVFASNTFGASWTGHSNGLPIHSPRSPGESATTW